MRLQDWNQIHNDTICVPTASSQSQAVRLAINQRDIQLILYISQNFMWHSNLGLWPFDVRPSGNWPFQCSGYYYRTMTWHDVTAVLLLQCLYAGWRCFPLVVLFFFSSLTSSPSSVTGRRPEYSTSWRASYPSLEVWFTLDSCTGTTFVPILSQ